MCESPGPVGILSLVAQPGQACHGVSETYPQLSKAHCSTDSVPLLISSSDRTEDSKSASELCGVLAMGRNKSYPQ